MEVGIRERIYNIIEPRSGSNKYANVYDGFMIVVILVSFVPLLFKESWHVLHVTDFVTAIIFSIDYILRWMTADLKLKKGPISFIQYPFMPFAIVDLLSILPGLVPAHPAFKLFRIARLVRSLRLFRIMKLFRYSRSVEIILNVIRQQGKALSLVLLLAVGYIFVSAVLLFQVEPETFDSFFDALYWATVSLTTVGYGDIYAVSTLGRVISMLSALMGVAVVALPASIITAGYVAELQTDHTPDNAPTDSGKRTEAGAPADRGNHPDDNVPVDSGKRTEAGAPKQEDEE